MSAASSSATLVDINMDALVEKLAQTFITSVAPQLQATLETNKTPRSLLPAKSIPVTISSQTLSTLQTLFPQNPRFRSIEQAEIIERVSRRQENVIGILPTAGGKTLVWELNALMSRKHGRCTVVMVPLVGLIKQHMASASAAGLMPVTWTDASTIPGDIVFAIFEASAKPEFIEWLYKLAQTQGLSQLLIDEIHYALYNIGFRPLMKQLATLQMFGVPIVGLTASLPPSDMPLLTTLCGIHDPTEIRAYTGRPRLRYTVQKVMIAQSMPETQVEFVFRCLQQLLERHPRSRCSIIYFQSKDELESAFTLCKDLEGGAKMVHAGTPDFDDVIKNWGVTFKTLLATSVIGIGYNNPKLDLVGHWGTPRSMVDFYQESGRAGRGGEDADSVILYSRVPMMPLEDEAGRAVLLRMLDMEICRRRHVEGFMDGVGSTCLSYPGTHRLCDVCERRVENAPQAPLPLLPVGLHVANSSNLAGQTSTVGFAGGPQVTQAPALVSTAEHPAGALGSNEPHAMAQATTAPPPMTLQARLERLKTPGCKLCYVEGRGFGGHGHGFFYCPVPGYALYTSFRAFKSAVRFEPGSGAWCCWMCWLPEGPSYHASGRGGCLYPDILPQVMWSVWNGEHWQQKWREWSGKDFQDVAMFCRWLSVEVHGKRNLVRVFEWLDAIHS